MRVLFADAYEEKGDVMFEKGRVALKVAGRDAGVCVVVDSRERRVLVLGPRVRKRWINPAHLEPLSDTLDVDKLSEDELVEKLKPADEELRKKQIDFYELESLKARLRR